MVISSHFGIEFITIGRGTFHSKIETYTPLNRFFTGYYLQEQLGWSHAFVGSFFAVWIMGYGGVQSVAPSMLRGKHHNMEPDGKNARFWVFLLAIVPVLSVIMLLLDGVVSQMDTAICKMQISEILQPLCVSQNWPILFEPTSVIIIGLGLFGVVFAVNSSLHSYLILAYSDHDKVALNVGFYYMSNENGRLVGTVASGYIYQFYGLIGCLIGASLFLLIAGGISFYLPTHPLPKKS